jgi:hypothetical protein
MLDVNIKITFATVLFILSSAFPVSAALLSSNWTVRVDTDAFTQRPDASARISNTNGDVLSVACNGIEESILSIQYLPKRYLGSSENLVQIKVGGNDTISGVLWEYTAKGAYTINEPFIELFTKNASDVRQQILVRAYDYEDQPIDAAFISINARSAINRVREACGASSM